MKFYTFELLIEKELDGEGYFAYTPTLPGCFSNGATIEEARRNIREAIQQHLLTLEAHGEPIAQSERLVQDRKSTRLNSSHQIISYALPSGQLWKCEEQGDLR